MDSFNKVSKPEPVSHYDGRVCSISDLNYVQKRVKTDGSSDVLRRTDALALLFSIFTWDPGIAFAMVNLCVLKHLFVLFRALLFRSNNGSGMYHFIAKKRLFGCLKNRTDSKRKGGG